IGTAEYNLALGERRANAGRDYLTSRGIGANRVRTGSYGEERPKDDNSREETRRPNPRAAPGGRLTRWRPTAHVERKGKREKGKGRRQKVRSKGTRDENLVSLFLFSFLFYLLPSTFYLVCIVPIKASASAEIRQLIAALRGTDDVQREAAIARLAVI